MRRETGVLFKASVAKANTPLSRKTTAPFHSVNSPAERFLSLQKTFGNRAVQSIVELYAGLTSYDNEAHNHTLNESNPDLDSSKNRLSASSSQIIQTRLKTGKPNDKYEQEADQMAEAIVNMPNAQSNPGVTSSNRTQNLGIQRQCAQCEGHTDQQEREDIEVHAKLRGDNGPQVNPHSIENQAGHLSGRGQELSDPVKSYFEPRFGKDFGSVRVHTDSRAAQLARSLNARAFTVGSDVVFGAGEYAPQTLEGKRLIAHELTHVLQQGNDRGTIRRKIQYDDKPAYSRLNPISTILNNQAVALTTPTFNGTQLADPSKAKTPQEAKQLYDQAGQTIFAAFQPSALKYNASTKECSFDDFPVKVSSNVMLPTEPSAKGWALDFPRASVGNPECNKQKGNVPVIMTGKPDNDAVLKFVGGNEQEHVDDLKKLYDTSLEPYFKWLLSLKGTGADAAACQASLMAAVGNKDAVLAKDFLKAWSDSVKVRDSGGGHKLKNKINVKNDCATIEIESSK
jgi:hypothetical protein